MPSLGPLLFPGVAVYRMNGLWRVSYCGCILALDEDRLVAQKSGRIYAAFLKAPFKVFVRHHPA